MSTRLHTWILHRCWGWNSGPYAYTVSILLAEWDSSAVPLFPVVTTAVLFLLWYRNCCPTSILFDLPVKVDLPQQSSILMKTLFLSWCDKGCYRSLRFGVAVMTFCRLMLNVTPLSTTMHNWEQERPLQSPKVIPSIMASCLCLLLFVWGQWPFSLLIY